jgi:hypothetical protein
MGRTLNDLLDQVESATEDPPVTVKTVLSHLGERSFSPVILVVALLMVSPLSGIPGAPTVSAVLIVIVGCQALLGRDHLWLPDFILRRTIPHERLRRAVEWLRRPAKWFDRNSHSRWPVLTTPPMRLVAMLTCVAVAAVWPVLELLPFVTSFGAGAVSLVSFGLLTRDGLYLLLGYGVIGGLAATAVALIDVG